MERFEVELDKLAEVAVIDLPAAGDYFDAAGLYVARCGGMNHRALFARVDEA